MADALRRELLHTGTCLRNQRQRIFRHRETVTPFITDSAVDARGIVKEGAWVQHTDHSLLQIIHALEIVTKFAEVITIQADSHGIDSEIPAAEIIFNTSSGNSRQ